MAFSFPEIFHSTRKDVCLDCFRMDNSHSKHPAGIDVDALPFFMPNISEQTYMLEDDVIPYIFQ